MVDVWKCKFHCYSEIVRYTDQEMTAIENYLPTTVPSGRGHITPCRATGEAPGLVRRQTVWGEHGKSLYQGSVRSYGQGSLSIGCSDEFHQVLQSRDCPGLSGTQLFLGGGGRDQGRGMLAWSVRVLCEPNKGDVCGVGFRLVGLHWKGRLAAGFFSSFFFFQINFYWSIATLQCCVSFCYTAKWIHYLIQIGFPFGLPSHSGHHIGH